MYLYISVIISQFRTVDPCRSSDIQLGPDIGDFYESDILGFYMYTVFLALVYVYILLFALHVQSQHIQSLLGQLSKSDVR